MPNRQGASKRGYSTNWRKLRDAVLKTPCVVTGAPWNPSFHLDHIIPRAQGGRDVPSNLQWVSARVHAAKTARNDGGFGNKINNSKGYYKTGCNAQGIPLGKNHHWKDNQR